MKIFHLTDMHFGNTAAAFSPDDLENALQQFSRDFQLDTTYLIVTGDVTFKGQTSGYEDATDVIKKAWIDKGGNNERFIACPGNHDICANSFSDFDKFLYSIRRSSSLNFENESAIVLQFQNCVIAAINSSHHRNHQFGLVDVDQLDFALNQAALTEDDIRPRVAIIHHHVIGVDANDSSTIKNALPLLHILEENRFGLLLHGHRHALSELVVGEHGMKVQAGRSLAFNQPGYANGMTIHELTADGWQSTHLFLSKDNQRPGKAIFAKQEKL
ncbi:metallophosphoesterase [Herbaspirillum sp. C7C2]|uniref:metallophosphoesterase family protein n=1 Tax=Herbaspirillum sp. C7C2 TaxID=2736666 RepID=UPI001F522AA0|nr:metallophosphoesterase [Herbaspirillum sp. C7C2]MCI1012639.1 metallophosphoesterase [Herbaspirillum sp. C7C2]